MSDSNAVMEADGAVSIVDAARSVVTSKVVHINGGKARGRMPLEWPRIDPATGKRAVDHDIKDSDGNVVDRIRYRPLEFGRNGIQQLNPADIDDAEFLALVKDWIANSGDSRIAKYGVFVDENANAEPEPFPRYNTSKSDAVIQLLELMLGEDDAANRELLASCARYELQRGSSPSDKALGVTGPRSEVLAAIDSLCYGSGIEAGDGVVEEEG